MKSRRSPWLTVLVWLGIAAAATALYLIPESNRITKASTLLVALIAWRGLFALTWKRPGLRWVLPALTLAAAVLLALPGRTVPAQTLREEYTSALRSYEGTVYSWGGESRRGIDCSGLIRCGLMNALAQDGLRRADGGQLRRALSLWWNDTSAEALGKQHAGLTSLLFQAPSINQADHSRLLPGDLAVTTNGVHILAYLGEGAWIQASPDADRVIITRVPAEDSWLRQPVRLLRWSVLAGD